MDTAAAKCELVIYKHRMPHAKKGRSRNKEWCKWIDDNWMTIGQTKFYKKEFGQALKIFQYVETHYEIENSYYIKIDGGAKNDTLKKQTFSEFILHNIKKSDSLTRQYSCNLILQNIMNNSADIRDHFYGQDIREAGFVLNKNGMMYQTKVPSQKRNNIHRPYLIGIRPDGRHIKEGGPFLKGQNLQCVVCDEIDYNQTIEPTYKSISMFDVQKVKGIGPSTAQKIEAASYIKQ